MAANVAASLLANTITVAKMPARGVISAGEGVPATS